MLTLTKIEITHEFITIHFDYQQNIPLILATMWIELNSTHFA